MKKQVTTSAQAVQTGVNNLTVGNRTNQSVAERIAETDFIQSMSELFSAVMEENVTPMQTLCLLNSVLAGLMLIFTACVPMMVRLIFLVWFGISLLQCRQAGMGKE